jgi:PAT family acetyl-CoA transporter-like MFS transporter 1
MNPSDSFLRFKNDILSQGPVCNSIGQNIGYFLSFVGFLALNDPDSSENLWRPLLRLPSRPGMGLVSLGGFIKFMGIVMLVITSLVAIFKREVPYRPSRPIDGASDALLTSDRKGDEDEDAELDASVLGLRETYHRLWAVCQLPAVRWLFLILLTYRLPTALSDNVKFLKAVEFGLSKQTTALLSPTLILPLGIAVPIIASKIWHNQPLRQFMVAYKLRVTVVALFDVLMLLAVRSMGNQNDGTSRAIFWSTVIGSTALQAIVSSLQFNAQMTFFANRVDPAIGGSYMTLLNTAANLGGTWPASFVMYLVGQLTIPPVCKMNERGVEVCTGGRDAYFPMQLVFSIMGCLWIFFLGNRVRMVSELPDEAWRTHLLDKEDGEDVLELGESSIWKRKQGKRE